MLAITHALKKWRHYLYGATFEVRIDHESLKWLFSQKELAGRKARWAQILREFDLQLRYQKGKFNIVADALSRMPMVNELCFTRFKSSLLESLKGLCEYHTSYAEVWRSIRRRNIQMQPPPPSFETRVSAERLAEFSREEKRALIQRDQQRLLGLELRRRTQR